MSDLQSILDKYNLIGIQNTMIREKDGEWKVEQETAGKAWISPSIPMTENTLLRIGSVTKVYTAIVILKLISQGLLSLDTKVKNISSFGPSINPEVNIGQLLSMTSGLSNYPNEKIFQYSQENPTHAWTYKELFSRLDPYHAPGSYEYCNTNYLLLGLIAKIVSQRSLSSLYEQYIFSPLHLSHTYYCDKAMIPQDQHNLKTHRMASCYNIEQGVPKDMNRTSISEISASKGAGGIVSTSLEMAQVMRGIFDSTLLTQKELEILTSFPPNTEEIPIRYSFASLGVSSASIRYSYGLTRIQCIQNGKKIVLWGKEGHVLSYESQMFYLPQYRVFSSLILNGADWSKNQSPLARFEILFRDLQKVEGFSAPGGEPFFEKQSTNFFLAVGFGVLLAFLIRKL